MGSAAADSGWVDEMIGLTVRPDGDWPTDQLVAAQVRVARLAVLVRALAPVIEDPTVARALATARGGRRAGRLVPLLAAELPLAADPARSRIAPSGADLVEAYTDALRHAAGAVYYCRRVQHATGACWFSVHGAEYGVCGPVLAVAHCLAEPAGD